MRFADQALQMLKTQKKSPSAVRGQGRRSISDPWLQKAPYRRYESRIFSRFNSVKPVLSEILRRSDPGFSDVIVNPVEDAMAGYCKCAHLNVKRHSFLTGE